ncbi:hypothetical protein [Pandoraea oxalativorans]|uniref:Uncharacterized protein n=1 Tax=Pandoraea oxalativorans TaxID=573737 RepID=A0A0G3IE31_9BURK|nr:hypothetical protein [Pandoraea oxalativorans]AKK24813.1 hypothetical protein MB84_28955 [Pandoraea oxalativorans]
MNIGVSTNVKSAANSTGIAGDAPLVFQFVTKKGVIKKFSVSLQDLQNAAKANPRTWAHWIETTWDSIRDSFCNTKVAKAKAYYCAAVRAQDERTMADNYFALMNMATDETRRTSFTQVFNESEGTVALRIEAGLDKGLHIEMNVKASALDPEDMVSLGIPQQYVVAALRERHQPPRAEPPRGGGVAGGPSNSGLAERRLSIDCEAKARLAGAAPANEAAGRLE